jgi:hypothetical protein
MFSIPNVSLSDCVAEMLDGQEKEASLTAPYKVGFNQGKDYLVLRSDLASFIKNVRSTTGILCCDATGSYNGK